MRDPQRIEKTLNKLRQAWQCYPDLRLGQLITITTAVIPNNKIDLFYVEDEKMLEGLDEFLKKKHTPDP